MSFIRESAKNVAIKTVVGSPTIIFGKACRKKIQFYETNKKMAERKIFKKSMDKQTNSHIKTLE